MLQCNDAVKVWHFVFNENFSDIFGYIFDNILEAWIDENKWTVRKNVCVSEYYMSVKKNISNEYAKVLGSVQGNEYKCVYRASTFY